MTTEDERTIREVINLAIANAPQKTRRMVNEYLNNLTHYRDSTVGLWVTDKPKSIEEKRLFFQLKFGKE